MDPRPRCAAGRPAPAPSPTCPRAAGPARSSRWSPARPATRWWGPPMPDAPVASAGAPTRRAARRPAGSRTWSRYLAAGAVVAVAYYLVPALGLAPRWAAKIGLYNGLGLSSVVGIVVGVLRYRPERPLPWVLFGVGMTSYVTADVIFYTYQDLLHRDVFPSLADVFYLAAYPFLV